MKIVNADLFTSTDKFILFTANSFINKNGDLSMGKGVAREFRNRYYRWLPTILGRKIQKVCGCLGKYGVIVVEASKITPYDYIGAFQTKQHYNNPSTLELVDYAVGELFEYSAQLEEGASMNFPGVGFGGLSVEQVFPLISILPDTVSIYVDDKTMKELKDKGLV